MSSATPRDFQLGKDDSFFAEWNRFWFRRADPLPVCFMRLMAGMVIFYVFFNYSFGLHSYFGPDGWIDLESINNARHNMAYHSPTTKWEQSMSSQPVGRGWPVFSIFFHTSNRQEVLWAHVVILTATFCFAIGLGTRVCGFIAWAEAISYVQRSPVTFFGMDNILVVLLFYLMLAPCGATLSVDRWLRKWWARRQGKPVPEVQPSMAANFVLRLLQLHFCFVYFAAGVSKLLGPAWWSGDAIWGTMVNYSFSPMNWPIYNGFVRAVAKYKAVYATLMILGAYGTIALEISFPFLIWQRRFRPWMICGSLLMHTGIGLVMGLSTFSLIMMCFVLCYFPPEAFHWFLDKLAHLWAKIRQFVRPQIQLSRSEQKKPDEVLVPQ